ncbi:MAG TPA: hypothetical protein VIP11_24505 [Gemmatimonadaceae bacterium]
MLDAPAVLVLVNDADQRERVRKRLIELEVVPIPVRADRAVAAVEQYRPIAALLDEAHAAMAPDDFLETTCTHHVRLLTLPDPPYDASIGDSVLESAAATRMWQ